MTSCMPCDYSPSDYTRFYMVGHCKNVFCDKIQVFIIQIVYACYYIYVEKDVAKVSFS